jgi:predicted dehydrogenase
LPVRSAENYVHYPPIVLAKSLIDEGEIGDPLNIRIKFIGGGRGGWAVPARAWKWRFEELRAGRGMQTFDHGHHMWSTAWCFLGPVKRVKAWIDRIDGRIDCPASVMWQHTRGIRYGMCEYVCAPDMYVPSKYYSADEWIEITGSRGIVQVNQCSGNISDRPPVSLYCDGKWRHFPEVDGDWASGFVGAARNFVAAIRGLEPPILTGEQGRQILRVGLAIQKSAEAGREIELDTSEID